MKRKSKRRNPGRKSICLTALAILTLSLRTTNAIIFPLPTEKYDHQKNLIYYSYAHNRGAEVGHFFNETSGCDFLGVAIAPNWFITADHTASGTTLRTFIDSTGKPHPIVQVVHRLNHPDLPDLALVKVADVLPFYSQIPFHGTAVDQLAKVYGLSSSAWGHGALKGASGRVQARYRIAGAGIDGLRWGLAKINRVWPGGFTWPFNPDDPEVGLDCAGVAVGDSGGGIFLRKNGNDNGVLIGITTQLTGSPYKISNVPSNTTECILAPLLWNSAGLYNCGTSVELPVGHRVGAQAQDVGYFSSNILQIISPPIKIAVSAIETNWVSFTPQDTGSLATNYVSETPSRSDGLLKPAPDGVYRKITLVSSSASRNRIAFSGNNLLRYANYRIRLHFANIPIQGLPYSKVSESVTISDATGSHSYGPIAPYENGIGKAMIFDLPGSFRPDSANRIYGKITPRKGSGYFAVVSGVEILIQTGID